MVNWEQRISAPGIKTANYRLEGNTRHFHLVAEPVKHNILKDVTLDTLGFNGSTPGPLIIIREGEYISLKFDNNTDKPMGLHIHGLVKPNSQDGAPAIEPATPKVNPGESYTYMFLIEQSGTFFYHSSNPTQVIQGLIGPFVVLPRETEVLPCCIPDKDYVLMLQQWQIPQPELGKVTPGVYKPSKFDQNPNFFTINGKAFPDTESLYVKLGQKIRLRFINKSSNSHTMHLHGHDFAIVNEDGFPRPGFMQDTISVESGKRFEVELLTNNPGIWPLNGTKSFHQTNNGEEPGGMITRVVYTL